MIKYLKALWRDNPSSFYGLCVSGIIALTLVGWGASYGICKLRVYSIKKHAAAALTKGLPAVAAEDMEPYRYALAKSPEGCLLLINANFQLRRTERLEWASQKCIDNGIDAPEIYLGQSAAFEFSGRDRDALGLLQQLVSKFPKNADVLYRMAYIHRRAKNDVAASEAFMASTRLAPQNTNLQIEVLEYELSLSRWKEAREIADRLRTVETDNPGVKLLVAKALKNGGDAVGAQNLVDQAMALLKNQPEVRAQYERAYPELMPKTKAE